MTSCSGYSSVWRHASRVGSFTSPKPMCCARPETSGGTFLRKKRTHAEALHDSYRDEDYVQTTEGPEAHAQGFQSLALILRALDELPTRSRYVFVLCRVERLPQKEVARRLGISVSAVEKHMMKALARLSTPLRLS